MPEAGSPDPRRLVIKYLHSISFQPPEEEEDLVFHNQLNYPFFRGANYPPPDAISSHHRSREGTRILFPHRYMKRAGEHDVHLVMRRGNDTKTQTSPGIREEEVDSRRLPSLFHPAIIHVSPTIYVPLRPLESPSRRMTV